MRTVAYCCAQMRLSNALHREAQLDHERSMLRKQIARAMALQEDHSELTLRCREVHEEWRQAVEEKLVAQQSLQELKHEPGGT
jgi:hypothetical protein